MHISFTKVPKSKCVFLLVPTVECLRFTVWTDVCAASHWNSAQTNFLCAHLEANPGPVFITYKCNLETWSLQCTMTMASGRSFFVHILYSGIFSEQERAGAISKVLIWLLYYNPVIHSLFSFSSVWTISGSKTPQDVQLLVLNEMVIWNSIFRPDRGHQQ